MWEFESTRDVVAWLMVGGAVAVFSMAAEYWQWFQGLQPDAKKYLSNVLVALIALVGYGTYTYVPVEVFENIDPFVKLFFAVVGSVGFKELWHKWVNKK